MNVRFRRLNKKAPASAKPEIKAAPLIELPPQIIIDDWLRREREKRKQQKDESERQIRLPLDRPLPPRPEISEPHEIIIDLNNPDNLVN